MDHTLERDRIKAEYLTTLPHYELLSFACSRVKGHRFATDPAGKDHVPAVSDPLYTDAPADTSRITAQSQRVVG
jgi:hypothetical protein